MQIRDAIIAGNLPPDRWLRLADLGRRLGTSTTPVRAALAELETQGLVEVAKARGFRVIPPTPEDVRDAYLVVAFVSGELAARAAERIDEGALATFEALRDRVRHAYETGSGEDVDTANWAFHRAITLLADSPRLARVLGATMRSVPHDFHRIVRAYTPRALEQHDELVAALAARDPGRARTAAARHVDDGCAHLLRYLDARRVKPAGRRRTP